MAAMSSLDALTLLFRFESWHASEHRRITLDYQVVRERGRDVAAVLDHSVTLRPGPGRLG